MQIVISLEFVWVLSISLDNIWYLASKHWIKQTFDGLLLSVKQKILKTVSECCVHIQNIFLAPLKSKSVNHSSFRQSLKLRKNSIYEAFFFKIGFSKSPMIATKWHIYWKILKKKNKKNNNNWAILKTMITTWLLPGQKS